MHPSARGFARGDVRSDDCLALSVAHFVSLIAACVRLSDSDRLSSAVALAIPAQANRIHWFARSTVRDSGVRRAPLAIKASPQRRPETLTGEQLGPYDAGSNLGATEIGQILEGGMPSNVADPHSAGDNAAGGYCNQERRPTGSTALVTGALLRVGCVGCLRVARRWPLTLKGEQGWRAVSVWLGDVAREVHAQDQTSGADARSRSNLGDRRRSWVADFARLGLLKKPPGSVSR